MDHRGMELVSSNTQMTREPITLERIGEALCDFGDTIQRGHHHCGSGRCCAVELANYLLGNKWSDSPDSARMFDLRPINDMGVSTWLRTKYMAKLLVAYQGSLDWPEIKILTVIGRLITLTQLRMTVSPKADDLLGMAHSNMSCPAYASARVAMAGAMAVHDAAQPDLAYETLCNLWLEAATEAQ